MRIRFVGESFGAGFAGLTNGKVYECLGVEGPFVRVIDDEQEDYLYSATAPRKLDGTANPGRWEVVEDDENGTLYNACVLKNIKTL